MNEPAAVMVRELLDLLEQPAKEQDWDYILECVGGLREVVGPADDGEEEPGTKLCPDSPDGEHEFEVDLEYDPTGSAVSCIHCGANQRLQPEPQPEPSTTGCDMTSCLTTCSEAAQALKNLMDLRETSVAIQLEAFLVAVRHLADSEGLDVYKIDSNAHSTYQLMRQQDREEKGGE